MTRERNNAEKILLTDADKQRILEITKELVSIESDSMGRQEREVGEYIAAFLERLGYGVERQPCDDDRFNVIARIPGRDGSSCIMYSGHMDTVPIGVGRMRDCLENGPEISEGRLIGRGTCDMKGSIACTLFVAEYFVEKLLTPENDILLVYDIDEENGNLGLKTYLKNPDKVDFVIVGEPTSLAVNIGHRGVMAFTVEIDGISAHVGKAELGRNALYGAVSIIEGIQRLQGELEGRRQEYLGSPSIHVTQLHAGEKVNVVPGKAVIRIDRRLVDGETYESCLAQLEGIVQSECRQSGCGYSISVTTFCPPGKTEPVNPQILALASLLEEFGMDSRLYAFGASCEAGMLGKGLDAPVAIFGPGSIDQAHKSDEYISIEQLNKGGELYLNLFYNLSRR